VQLVDRSKACARLSVLSNQATADLEASLVKWFAKHFVKGINVPLLKRMNGSEAYTAFKACLGASGEADLIAIVRKLDPHRAGLLTRSGTELVAHLDRLAAGDLEPAPKPQKPKPTRKRSSQAAPKSGGVLARSRQSD
jgi:hypothetical protein